MKKSIPDVFAGFRAHIKLLQLKGGHDYHLLVLPKCAGQSTFNYFGTKWLKVEISHPHLLMAVFLEKQCSQDQYQVSQQLSPWRILLCFIRKLMQSGAELDLSIIMSSETENAERTEKPMTGRMELAIDSRPV